MKNISTLFVAFLILTKLSAQHSEAITKDVTAYFNLLKAKKVSASVDYIYPKIYDIVPREKLETSIEATFNDPTLAINFSDMLISNVSKTIVHEEVKYALVSYSYTMTIKSLEDLGKDFEKQLLQSYHETFGKENVVFDKKSKTYIISMKTSMYAIYAANYDTWKFLENKKGMELLMHKMIPEDVINGLQ